MLKMPLVLLLLAAAPAGAAAQGPPAAREPGKVLAKALLGDLLGPQRTPTGSAQGWMRVEPVLGGQWVRAIGASLVDGRPQHSFLQMMREAPDGAVEAWLFESSGRFSRWTGQVEQRGMSLEWRDEEGVVQARQDWGFENGDCDYRFLRRASADAPFVPTLSGLLRAGGSRPSWEPSKEARERLAASPYAFYLGSFRGKETSSFGDSEGSTRTEGVLDGEWFHSVYRSMAGGAVVYEGRGLIQCDEKGAFALHWFDTYGEYQRLDGQLEEQGAVARRRDAEGRVVERQTDRRTSVGYTFTIEQRPDPESPWSRFMTATYTKETRAATDSDGQGGD